MYWYSPSPALANAWYQHLRHTQDFIDAALVWQADYGHTPQLAIMKQPGDWGYRVAGFHPRPGVKPPPGLVRCRIEQPERFLPPLESPPAETEPNIIWAVDPSPRGAPWRLLLQTVPAPPSGTRTALIRMKLPNPDDIQFMHRMHTGTMYVAAPESYPYCSHLRAVPITAAVFPMAPAALPTAPSPYVQVTKITVNPIFTTKRRRARTWHEPAHATAL